MANKLTSKETKSMLKISDCELMHLRESGAIQGKREGRSFLYDLKSIKRYIEGKEPN